MRAFCAVRCLALAFSAAGTISGTVTEPPAFSTASRADDDTPATVTVRPQDSWDDARVQAVNEAMRFGVWTGLAAHRPLGNINRARNATYRHSADFRARVNGCPYHEPSAA